MPGTGNGGCSFMDNPVAPWFVNGGGGDGGPGAFTHFMGQLRGVVLFGSYCCYILFVALIRCGLKNC